MRKDFKLNYIVVLVILIFNISCANKERLNPQDPLSPYYQPDVITIVSNINITLSYTNSSIIDEDTVWTHLMSPIKILQNILVTSNAILTIEQDTVVEFYSIGGSEVGIIVDGGLRILGTSTKPVRFVAKDGALSYIVFRNISDDSICVIQYSDLSDIFITCIASAPRIFNNKIKDISIYSGGTPIIKFNDIEVIVCEDSAPVIYSNQFYSATFNRNILIKGNSYPVVRYNNILGSSAYFVENLSNITQYFTNNYWGTTSTNTINSNIYDYYDNSAYGAVIYKPFLTNSIAGAGAGW